MEIHPLPGNRYQKFNSPIGVYGWVAQDVRILGWVSAISTTGAPPLAEHQFCFGFTTNDYHDQDRPR